MSSCGEGHLEGRGEEGRSVGLRYPADLIERGGGVDPRRGRCRRGHASLDLPALRGQDGADLRLCERYFDELGRVTTEAGRGSVDPVESLRLLGRAYIQFGLDNPEPYRVLFMRKPSATPLPFQYEKILESSGFSNLVRAVSRAIEAGRIEGDPMLVATYLWSVVHGLTSLLISKPDFPWPDLDPLIDQVTRSALRGVLAEA